MLSQLSVTILALAFFLQSAVAFPWGWSAHPSGFNGTHGHPAPSGTAPAWGTGFPTGFPTGTGLPVPTGGYYAKRSEEDVQQAKRFEGPRQLNARGYYPFEGYYVPEGTFPTAGPTGTGTGYPKFPYPTGTGAPLPTGTGW